MPTELVENILFRDVIVASIGAIALIIGALITVRLAKKDDSKSHIKIEVDDGKNVTFSRDEISSIIKVMRHRQYGQNEWKFTLFDALTEALECVQQIIPGRRGFDELKAKPCRRMIVEINLQKNKKDVINSVDLLPQEVVLSVGEKVVSDAIALNIIHPIFTSLEHRKDSDIIITSFGIAVLKHAHINELTN